MMRESLRARGLAPLLVLAVLCALSACDVGDDADTTCEVAGRTVPDGTVWTCADGCNGCWCEGGQVSSTAAACLGPPGPAANKLSCEDGGRERRHGDSWQCSDGCGSCGCDDGVITRDDASCGAAGGAAR